MNDIKKYLQTRITADVECRIIDNISKIDSLDRVMRFLDELGVIADKAVALRDEINDDAKLFTDKRYTVLGDKLIAPFDTCFGEGTAKAIIDTGNFMKIYGSKKLLISEVLKALLPLIMKYLPAGRDAKRIIKTAIRNM